MVEEYQRCCYLDLLFRSDRVLLMYSTLADSLILQHSNLTQAIHLRLPKNLIRLLSAPEDSFGHVIDYGGGTIDREKEKKSNCLP